MTGAPTLRAIKVLFEFKDRRRGSACDGGRLHHDARIIGGGPRVSTAAIPPTNHQKRSTLCRSVLPQRLSLLLLLLTDALYNDRIWHGWLLPTPRECSQQSCVLRFLFIVIKTPPWHML